MSNTKDCADKAKPGYNRDQARQAGDRNMRFGLERRWVDFANGRWIADLPSKTGRYPTATRKGYRGPDIVVATDPEGNLVSLEEWDGLWWSKPYPSLPMPNLDAIETSFSRKR